jgi:hypothetical protein
VRKHHPDRLSKLSDVLQGLAISLICAMAVMEKSTLYFSCGTTILHLYLICTSLQAMGGRDAAGLLPLIRFLNRYIANPRYSAMCMAVTHRLMDMYAGLIGRYPPPLSRHLPSLPFIIDLHGCYAWTAGKHQCMGQHQLPTSQQFTAAIVPKDVRHDQTE